jgi:predicted TIM-barrel fold metal-dependent hydrolase
MRDGYRVYDPDTHIHPSVESLEPYFDPEFRPRLAELAQYRVQARSDQTTTPREDPSRHHYNVGLTPYRRVLGQAGPAESPKDGHNRLHFGGYTGRKLPAVGVIDDAVDARVADMDEEGTDVHAMVPDVTTGFALLGDPSIEVSVNRAYHRFMNDLCSKYPGRLKAHLAVTGSAVEDSVLEIKTWGDAPWAVGIWPYSGVDKPLDHPDLEPIWAAAAEKDLAVVHHSTTWVPPYFPGYRDVDDNRFLARLCSHPWGAMKTMAAFIGCGVMDRYPDLRFGVLESGVGWLPFWVRRMEDQVEYVGFTADLQHKVSDYITGGRFFASIELAEGEDMINMVRGFLGDDVLMYASDYPHAECKFPESPAIFLGWSDMSAETKQKLVWDNAVRFFGEP